MKDLLVFLVGCFMAGLLLQRVSIGKLYLIIGAACVLLAISYYFFGRI